jgi:hypothetical protein
MLMIGRTAVLPRSQPHSKSAKGSTTAKQPMSSTWRYRQGAWAWLMLRLGPMSLFAVELLRLNGGLEPAIQSSRGGAQGEARVGNRF